MLIRAIRRVRDLDALIVETRFALGPDGATLPLPSLRARTRILFDGASRIQIDSEPRRSDDGTLVWEGARGTLVSPPGGFETLTGRVRAPRLELRTEAGTFRVEDLSVGVDSDGRAGELPLGRFESQVARLALERPGSRMQLTGLHFEETGSLDVVNDTYRLTVRAGFEQLELDAGRYGPGAFELVFRNLDPGALEALQALQQPGVAGGDPGDPTQHPLQGALQLLPRLLRSSPELELTRLDLEGDAGALRIRAKLGVDGEDERVLMGPLSALAAVRAKADAYASATLLHAAVESFAAAQLRETGLGPDALADDPSRIRVLRDRILSGLEGGGVLYPEGDGYRLRADYRDGQLYLNGIPVDPGALTGAPPITARSSR